MLINICYILLGEADSDFRPAILACIDTGATLTVGYSGYILGICEMYPALVASTIVWAEDKYLPIELCGVNDDGSTKPKSENYLSAVVTFHMPYVTSNHHPTSVSFAIGKQVAVNVLLGMSFIQTTKMIINMADGVVESKVLQCDPFDIIFKRATRSLPNKIPEEFIPDQTVFHSNGTTDRDYAETLQLIASTRHFLDGLENDGDVHPRSLKDALFYSEMQAAATISSFDDEGALEVTMRPTKKGKTLN